ncbi:MULTISPECIES: lysozyme inhibitor LprI family protein [unclassified Pseudocitrobacter]|uniref:lysozyme inhibitor LprI family protein n=1 Tax=unclassified Pseudocitrobacter TaxID=2638778 RepID=UPI0023E39EC8|nr:MULTISPECIES: lysozyme inhibitor LprI family protein [unclassified Pseudocitrobacter]MDF3829505.1 DUF1311 domain-containing protein [Pseudocitrobacter sp. 2023EL-00150]MEC5374881.1 DUF1311 domain-containing protein [Pseudocitrobacter sp. MW920760]
MLRKTIFLLLVLSPTLSHAGLFESEPELKCGNDNVIAAAKAWFYDESLSQLQNSYIQTPELFHGIPQNTYEQQLRAIPIQFGDVTTLSLRTGMTQRNCTAKISAGIPQATLDLLKILPESLNDITQGNGQVLNNDVVWKEVKYEIQVADNGKDIIVNATQDIKPLTTSIYNIATLAVAKDALIRQKNDADISMAEQRFNRDDRELNIIWQSLPDSSRAALKKEQQVWVTQKAQKCGKISDAKSEAVPAAQRINIYQCQQRLTGERIAYLGGEDPEGD